MKLPVVSGVEVVKALSKAGFYVKEIEFRFNNRDEDLFPLLARMLVKLVPDS